MTLLPDAQRLQNLLERARQYAKDTTLREGRIFEDSDNPVARIQQWCEESGDDVQTELYYKGRQAGRVAMARQMLKILGVPHND